jgi:hypothetical protein
MQELFFLTKAKENLSTNKNGVLATEKDLELSINTPQKNLLPNVSLKPNFFSLKQCI